MYDGVGYMVCVIWVCKELGVCIEGVDSQFLTQPYDTYTI